MRERLTKSEMAIMEILWEEGKGLTATEIVNIAGEKKTWKDSSIHLLINKLLDKGVIEVVGFRKTMKNYARTFFPVDSKQKYIVNQITDGMSEEERKKLYEYPIYDRLINELELEKDTTEGRDINSSIRSKNKINRGIESQVIKNISIDNKIKEYKQWKELIDNVLQEFRKCDKTKLKVIEYKFFGNIPEDIIADELYVSKTTVRTYINDIYFEIGILASLNNLISSNILKL